MTITATITEKDEGETTMETRRAINFTLGLLMVTATMATAGEPVKPESIQLQDFEDRTAITPNQDGGQPPAFSLDNKNFRAGNQGLRIVYKNGPQGWGNLSLPARWLQWTDAVTLQVLRESAATNAAMHLWLCEKDGDLWVSPTIAVAKLRPGWNTVRVPVADFRYDKRGDGKPDLANVNRLMIGCNSGDFVVVVDDLRQEGRELAAKSAAYETERNMVVIREEESVVASFLGFGAEWDPKFWTMGTFKLDEDFKGEVTVTEADWDLVVKRIRWMRLPFVRMMICSRWLSAGDGKFDWTNKHMQSLYRHLDVCQKEKIGVILTDWGCEPAWLKVPGIADVADPKYAETIGTYLDYLINTKGYTCIQYFVMVNEPEGEVRDWNRWKKGVQNVTRVLGERKLQEKICFLGSDESAADAWHRNAVDQLSKELGGYDIHRYASVEEVRRGGLYRHFKTMWDYALEKDVLAKSKPMIVCEAGLSAPGFSAGNNSLNLDPAYATQMADYGVQAVNAGSWGVLAWMLDDSSHAGFNWGMWKNKAGGFELKPWFYTWSLLSRLYPPRSHIVRVESLNEDLRVLAARLPKESGGGWSFCIVNRGMAGTVTLKVPGSPAVKFNRYVFQGKEKPLVDADGFPAPVEPVSLDLSKGAQVAVPGDGVVFLTGIGVDDGRGPGVR